MAARGVDGSFVQIFSLDRGDYFGVGLTFGAWHLQVKACGYASVDRWVPAAEAFVGTNDRYFQAPMQERLRSATDAARRGRARLGVIANIHYAGQAFSLGEAVNVDELAEVLLDAYANGGYSWLWVDVADAQPKRVQLMVGPGIPVAIVSDQMDSHDGGG